MKERQNIVGAIIALIIAFGSVLGACGYNYLMTNGQVEQIVQPLVKYDPDRIWSRTTELTATKNATRHFEKHKDEFGFQNIDQYMTAAVDLVTNTSPDILKTKQRDGDIAYYNPKTAEYAVKSMRGRIRTYFKLDPKIHGYATNLDYFKAQAKKPANDNMKPYTHRPLYNRLSNHL